MKVYISKQIGDKSTGALTLLEYAVKEEYGIDLPEIVRDSFGKPTFPHRADIFFSLSHSGMYIACAVGDEPVGVDIQQVKNVSDKTKNRICSTRERENTDFISLWCMKESFIKLKGRLDRAYDEIEFLPKDDIYCGPEGAFCELLNAPAGYKLAVCRYEKPGSSQHLTAICFKIAVDY